MEIVPCSRVGHFFRTLPYTFNGDKNEVKIRNNIRIAKVWMDEYKPYFDVVTTGNQPEIEYLFKNDLLNKLFAIK